MGHVVSQKSIATNPEKVKAFKEFPEPHDLTTLRLFLGCAGYYRRFIPNFGDIASPLYGLERKGANFKWTTECQAAFDTLKKRLTSSPILAYPNFDRPFILDTDASDQGCRNHGFVYYLLVIILHAVLYYILFIGHYIACGIKVPKSMNCHYHNV